jgi:hypothetical protein
MKTVTVDQVMAWHPCANYTREVVAELFAGRDALTARDIAALDISAEDRLWALLHPEFLTEAEMHEAACVYAEKVVHLCDDPRARAAIDAKRAWLRGEISDDELAAARAATRAAWAAWAARDTGGAGAAWAVWAAAGVAGAARAVWAAAWAAWAARDAGGAEDDQIAYLVSVIEATE